MKIQPWNGKGNPEKLCNFNILLTGFCYGEARMAFLALPRPDMPAPQPVEATKVSRLPPAGKQAPPSLRGSSGEAGDRIFKFAMLLCGLAVLAMLVLIVYELVVRSGPSWHAFGFKFFAGHDWDPVNEQFGAMPFIYGTLVSSLLALLIALPLSIGVAVFTTEMCPAALRGPLSFFV
jgi:phosphate transport system permease protein